MPSNLTPSAPTPRLRASKSAFGWSASSSSSSSARASAPVPEETNVKSARRNKVFFWRDKSQVKPGGTSSSSPYGAQSSKSRDSSPESSCSVIIIEPPTPSPSTLIADVLAPSSPPSPPPSPLSPSPNDPTSPRLSSTLRRVSSLFNPTSPRTSTDEDRPCPSPSSRAKFDTLFDVSAFLRRPENSSPSLLQETLPPRPPSACSRRSTTSSLARSSAHHNTPHGFDSIDDLTSWCDPDYLHSALLTLIPVPSPSSSPFLLPDPSLPATQGRRTSTSSTSDYFSIKSSSSSTPGLSPRTSSVESTAPGTPVGWGAGEGAALGLREGPGVGVGLGLRDADGEEGRARSKFRWSKESVKGALEGFVRDRSKSLNRPPSPSRSSTEGRLWSPIPSAPTSALSHTPQSSASSGWTIRASPIESDTLDPPSALSGSLSPPPPSPREPASPRWGRTLLPMLTSRSHETLRSPASTRALRIPPLPLPTLPSKVFRHRTPFRPPSPPPNPQPTLTLLPLLDQFPLPPGFAAFEPDSDHDCAEWDALLAHYVTLPTLSSSSDLPYAS